MKARKVIRALKFSVRFATLLAGVAAGLMAHADQIIYNNINSPSGGQDQILESGPLFDSFTAETNEIITGIRLALGSYGPTGTGSLNIGLYTFSSLDSSAVPILITNFAVIPNSSIAGGAIVNYIATLTARPALTAGTRYWIGVSDYDDDAITWSWSSYPAAIGEAGEYWANDGGIVHSNSFQGPYQMELSVSSIPEGVIYDNVLSATTGIEYVLEFGHLFNSFTATTNETITGLQLALGNFIPAGFGNVSVGLYTLSTLDSSAVPTLITKLGTISNSAIALGGINDYIVSLTDNPALTAGTRYWIGLSADDGNVVWSHSSDISGVGVAGEYWVTYGENGCSIYPNSFEGPYQMRLSVLPSTNGIVYYNLGAASSGSDQILYFGPLFSSFTAPTCETLTGLHLALENDGLADPLGSLEAGLYSLSTLDSLAVPTLIANLGTIANSGISTGGVNDYSVPLQSHPLLTAGTRYWIGLSDYDDGSIRWSWPSDTSGIGVNGEYWANDGGNVHSNTDQGPYQMIVMATPVPPTPSITQSGNSITVSWPNTGNYTLQEKTNGSISSVWTTSPYPVTTNGSPGTNFITITEPAGSMFFRLTGPSNL